MALSRTRAIWMACLIGETTGHCGWAYACFQSHLHNEIDMFVVLAKYEDKCDWMAWFGSLT